MRPSSRYAGLRATSEAGPLERLILGLILLGIIVIYAALGRDIFSNSLVIGRNDDLISTVLPFLRILICGAGLAMILATTDLRWMIDRIPWLFLPFVVIALASTLWSADPKATLRNAAGLAAMWIALPLVISRFGLGRSVRLVLHVIAVVLIVSTLLALFVPAIGRHTGLEVMQQSHIGRWRGIFAHKNALGGWAALGTVFLFTNVRPRGLLGLPYWWTARGCAVLCLAMAQSATAIVLAAVLLAARLALYLLHRLPRPLAVLVNLLLAISVAMLLVISNDALFDVLGRNAGLTGRPLIWAIAEHFFWMRPVLGAGFGSLGGPEFLEYVLTLVGQAIPGPESGYLVLLLETGVVGTACFFLAVLLAFAAGLSWLPYVEEADRKAVEFALMVLVGALVTGIAESRAFIYYGADTIISYAMLLSLLALPKAPPAVARARMRLASSFLAARQSSFETEVTK